ncbi:hypothetical protein ZWY2020_022893 [Hordeum vulgare]|nr:hypothetical protein ZWY2020_022893 [Hordeum vulgare]
MTTPLLPNTNGPTKTAPHCSLTGLRERANPLHTPLLRFRPSVLPLPLPRSPIPYPRCRHCRAHSRTHLAVDRPGAPLRNSPARLAAPASDGRRLLLSRLLDAEMPLPAAQAGGGAGGGGGRSPPS